MLGSNNPAATSPLHTSPLIPAEDINTDSPTADSALTDRVPGRAVKPHAASLQSDKAMATRLHQQTSFDEQVRTLLGEIKGRLPVAVNIASTKEKGFPEKSKLFHIVQECDSLLTEGSTATSNSASEIAHIQSLQDHLTKVSQWLDKKIKGIGVSATLGNMKPTDAHSACEDVIAKTIAQFEKVLQGAKFMRQGEVTIAAGKQRKEIIALLREHAFNVIVRRAALVDSFFPKGSTADERIISSLHYYENGFIFAPSEGRDKVLDRLDRELNETTTEQAVRPLIALNWQRGTALMEQSFFAKNLKRKDEQDADRLRLGEAATHINNVLALAELIPRKFDFRMGLNRNVAYVPRPKAAQTEALRMADTVTLDDAQTTVIRAVPQRLEEIHQYALGIKGALLHYIARAKNKDDKAAAPLPAAKRSKEVIQKATKRLERALDAFERLANDVSDHLFSEMPEKTSDDIKQMSMEIVNEIMARRKVYDDLHEIANLFGSRYAPSVPGSAGSDDWQSHQWQSSAAKAEIAEKISADGALAATERAAQSTGDATGKKVAKKKKRAATADPQSTAFAGRRQDGSLPRADTIPAMQSAGSPMAMRSPISQKEQAAGSSESRPASIEAPTQTATLKVDEVAATVGKLSISPDVEEELQMTRASAYGFQEKAEGLIVEILQEKDYFSRTLTAESGLDAAFDSALAFDDLMQRLKDHHVPDSDIASERTQFRNSMNLVSLFQEYLSTPKSRAPSKVLIRESRRDITPSFPSDDDIFHSSITPKHHDIWFEVRLDFPPISSGGFPEKHYSIPISPVYLHFKLSKDVEHSRDGVATVLRDRALIKMITLKDEENRRRGYYWEQRSGLKVNRTKIFPDEEKLFDLCFDILEQLMQ
jgi:hypothetical protein